MRRTILDWRFLAMLTVLVLVLVICWGFVQRVRQAETLIAVAEHSAQVAAQQGDELKEQRRMQRSRALQASAERDQLLAQIRGLQAQLASLGKYLRVRGIDVPDRAVTPPPLAPRTSTFAPLPAPDQPGRSDGNRAKPKKGK